MADQTESCVPGDIVVRMTVTGNALVVGLAIEKNTSGHWWKYLGTAETRADAEDLALKLAADAKTRAWRYIEGDGFERIWTPVRALPVGAIVVCGLPYRYVIGRVQNPHARDWRDDLVIMPDEAVAIDEARRLATSTGTAAFRERARDGFERI